MKRVITSWEEVPVVMDIAYLSRILGEKHETLKKKCQKGIIPAFKTSEDGHWRIEKDKLRKHIEAETQKHEPQSTPL